MRVELIPNIPCPHCEKQNTTHRLVRKEDGFTKVSRRCTSCSNEWTHTWDRDWLADAKIKRLSAENIELRARVERLQQEDTKTRHALKGWVWVCPDGGDEPTHERVAAIVSEVERLRADRTTLLAEIDRLRARVERLREERETLLRDARGLLRWLSRYDPITYKDLLANFDTEKLWRRLDGYD